MNFGSTVKQCGRGCDALGGIGAAREHLLDKWPELAGLHRRRCERMRCEWNG